LRSGAGHFDPPQAKERTGHSPSATNRNSDPGGSGCGRGSSSIEAKTTSVAKAYVRIGVKTKSQNSKHVGDKPYIHFKKSVAGKAVW
jgi:hypothetical protein